MKILWLTLDSLLPMNTAGRIGVAKRLEYICRENEVYLFYFFSCATEAEQCRQLEKWCKEVKGYKRENNKIKILLNYLIYPYTVSTRINANFIKGVEECIKNHNIELINIDFPQMGYSLFKCRNLPDVKIVMNHHNIEWQRFDEISKSKSISIMRRLLAKAEALKLKKYEEYLYKKIAFNAHTFVTPDDMEYFIKWSHPQSKILKVIPGGADLHPAQSKKSVGFPCVIFVGVMSNELNPEGAFWFIENVWPKVKKEVPQAKFYVVGKDPVKRLKEIASSDIVVTGFVNDLDAFYEMADVVVIPVIHGGGVKLKLLEAIGYGKPVISTSVGARGTEFKHGRDILITDNADLFAKYTIDILKNPTQYTDLVSSARRLFERKFTWRAIGSEYNLVLKSILEHESKEKRYN